jgi:hypothetical protein
VAKIQANSKFSQIYPNPAKSSQAQAKSNQAKRLDFLVRNERYQGLALTPQCVFILPALFARNRSHARRIATWPGACLFSMSALLAASFQAIVTYFSEKCKKNVDKGQKSPEFRAKNNAP